MPSATTYRPNSSSTNRASSLFLLFLPTSVMPADSIDTVFNLCVPASPQMRFSFRIVPSIHGVERSSRFHPGDRDETNRQWIPAAKHRIAQNLLVLLYNKMLLWSSCGVAGSGPFRTHIFGKYNASGIRKTSEGIDRQPIFIVA